MLTKRIYLIFILTLLISFSYAQYYTDSGTFLIHKFEQNIGKEKYSIRKNQEVINYIVDFKYVDRGSKVSLQAKLEFTSSLQPLSFRIKGKTSRFSKINDSVVINKKTALIKVDDSVFTKKLSGLNFTVAGYSPAIAQMLLIEFWKRNHKPVSINLLPLGSVQISRDGADTLYFDKKPLVLDRYVIKGLVWGNELLWTDAKGQLFCLITNDAEGDKQEMMFEPYETLLPLFINKAAIYGMRLFTKVAKPSFQKHDIIAITGGTVIDVVNDRTIPNATCIIEHGKIRSVGLDLKIPSNAFVINAKGKTLLPGLWDMHAHFEQAEWGPAYLASGVTSVRDCGNEFGYINTIQKAIDEGNGIGPHILKAGIIDGKGKYSLGIIQADSKEEAIQAVDRYKQNGFVQIKVYSSVKPAILKAICDEAHKQGLTVTGHIPMGMNLMQAVDSGLNMVNHIDYVYDLMKMNPDNSINMNDSSNQRILSFIRSHHVVIDVTAGVFELVFRSLHENITDIEPNFKSLPLPLQTIFTNTGQSIDSNIIYGRSMMKSIKEIIRAMYKDSITIVAGTDMGFPGYSVFRELELYVESGLTPMQSLKTATITPAEVMNLAAVSGSIEIGKNADIIIIDGDPLKNIRNIRKISTVIKDGKVYDPGLLHHIAGFSDQ
jgi:hypothetical protein